MSKLAKFFVGQEVMVESKRCPQYNTKRTEVVYSHYISAGLTTDHSYRGWVYKTAHQPEMDKVWVEESLKPIPPDSRTSWEDCIWQPNKIEEYDI